MQPLDQRHVSEPRRVALPSDLVMIGGRTSSTKKALCRESGQACFGKLTLPKRRGTTYLMSQASTATVSTRSAESS